MTEPNGMTYMTEEERKILGTLKQHPTNILTLSHCPSEEFLLTAVFENPYIIRFVHNQSFWLRMLAIVLDKGTLKYVNGLTPEMRNVASSKTPVKITDLNMPHYLLEIYANAHNIRRHGIAALNERLGR
jgi:hypothetical protein